MHILVVGGGMGGTILANNLARRLSGELEQGSSKITMLSASDKHMYQPGLLYVAVGKMSTTELYRDQKSLLEPSIDFHVDPVEKFDLDNNSVTTKSGKKISYDILCIATGSRGNAAGIPGLAEHACQFYTEADALAMYKKLQKFEGGKVVVATGVPHKCPMSPLEITFFLIDYFKKRGIWDKVDLHYTYPIGRVHSLEPVANWAAPEFDKEGVYIIGLMHEWEKSGRKVKGTDKDLGGTMRLGSYDAILKHKSKIRDIYKSRLIKERHRHRYEVDISYKEKFEERGLIFSGLSPDHKLPEIIELKNHPWFIGVQFHPEFKSRPLNPHPLFSSFIKAAKNHR